MSNQPRYQDPYNLDPSSGCRDPLAVRFMRGLKRLIIFVGCTILLLAIIGLIFAPEDDGGGFDQSASKTAPAPKIASKPAPKTYDGTYFFTVPGSASNYMASCQGLEVNEWMRIEADLAVMTMTGGTPVDIRITGQDANRYYSEAPWISYGKAGFKTTEVLISRPNRPIEHTMLETAAPLKVEFRYPHTTTWIHVMTIPADEGRMDFAARCKS